MIPAPAISSLSREDFPSEAEWIEPLLRAFNGQGQAVSNIVTQLNAQSGVVALDVDVPSTHPVTDQESVTAPTLAGTWANYGLSYTSAGYWRDTSGVVHIQGMVKSGGAALIFTLPAGYRPSATYRQVVDTSGGGGVLEITSSGAVNMASGNNAYFCLDGTSFRAADVSSTSAFPKLISNPLAVRAAHVYATAVVERTDPSETQTSAVRAVFVEWENASASDGSRMLKIKNVSGLEASTNYRITLKVES
jgi:hypothetical protein